MRTDLGPLANEIFQLKGAEILIKANEAHGNLKVALIGLNGKHGRNGDELDVINKVQRSINPNLNGRNGEDGASISVPMPCLKGPCPLIPVCTKPPTNGADGLPGAEGTPGEDGEPGGNSGSLFVDIKHSQDFSLEVGEVLGKPGRGGIGGPGSPGGLPGKAGKNPGACPDAHDGKVGAQGPQGPNGKLGAEGKLGIIHT